MELLVLGFCKVPTRAVQEGVEEEETSTNPEDEEARGDGGGNRKELDAKANQVATKSQLGISEVVAGGDGGRKPRSGFEREPRSGFAELREKAR
ncbi:hypothetical protein SLEP1_g41121 [Rubroshorea leprosula]|uniref:Uncharacterized protein n=1 Tax=Rubroshorea leprosula TaxID=152421 RepID=A0AAV5L5N2_9ROSI|nr:hypothetical protein SLEP1_g41121 [Rubroshorea leprosula]